MKLAILTIVLDGMPWLPIQLHTFNQLKCDWHYYIVHGAAMNVKDTSWMKPQSPRLSQDGTTEWLATLSNHPRITVLEHPLWPGKTAMFNAALGFIEEPCVLFEVDVDEVWNVDVIHAVLDRFKADRKLNGIRFHANYFVGPNVVVTSEGGFGNNDRLGEWHRVFRFAPGQQFITHEPPNFDGNKGKIMSRQEAQRHGLSFHHYAYVTEDQVRYKERVYGYPGAVNGWRRLQGNTQWPVRLSDFMPWADSGAIADLFAQPKPA